MFPIVQSMNEELNASLATADELSRQFDSLLKEVAPETNTLQVLYCESFFKSGSSILTSFLKVTLTVIVLKACSLAQTMIPVI